MSNAVGEKGPRSSKSLSCGDIHVLAAEQEAGDTLSELRIPARPPTVMYSVDPHAQENQHQSHRGRELYTWTMLLSIIYAMLLVLIGVVFTVHEALTKKWLVKDYIAAYLAYLFVVSVIFLVYLEIVLRRRKPKKTKEITSDTTSPSEVDKNKANVDGGRRSAVAELPKDTVIVHFRNYKHPAVGVSDNTSQGGCDSPHLSTISMHSSQANLLNESGSCSSVHYPISGTQRKRSVATIITEYGENLSIDLDHEGFENDTENFEDEVIHLQQTASLGHAGPSFYLRLGCLLFGIGNFVYVSLEIRASSDAHKKRCDTHPFVFQLILQLIFHLVQTFFLFKHSYICVKKNKSILRFGLQHLLATNLVIWIRTLVKEITEMYMHGHSEESASNVSVPTVASAYNVCSSTQLPTMSSASPYLFPFVLEYSLIAVAVMAGMYQSLNIRIQVDLLQSLKRAARHRGKSQEKDVAHEALFVRAHTGLYLGVIFLTGVIIATITFFLYQVEDDRENTRVSFLTCQLCSNVLHITTICFAFYLFRRLDFTFTRHNTIDEVLLILSMSGMVLLKLFVILAASMSLQGNNPDNQAALEIAESAFSIVMAILQACFILDGLQRYSADKKQQQLKPGRGAITFLIIANLSMWLFCSLTEKHVGDISNMFYGDHAWPIISNIGLPLSLFFRFHSSVCLADMWSSAYLEEEEEHFKMF